MSPRDLPPWARGTTAVLVLIAAWYVPRSDSLAPVVGSSALEISAGVVAVSILLGMRLPLDLWPQHPERERFSLPAAAGAAVVMGVVLVLAEPTELPAIMADTDSGALFAIIVGGAVWALAWGRLHQRVFLRWYGFAAAAAGIPVLVGVIALAIQGGALPTISWGQYLRVAGFFLVVGSAGTLVTQEIAFRRVLVGQAGDAGLATVLLAAVVFGAWHGLAPDPVGGVLRVAVTASLHGVVLGSLYALSRSLLVPAFYHGVSTAALRAFDLTAAAPDGAPPYADRMTWAVVATAIVASGLGYQVLQRSGFLGVLRRRQVIHAAGD